MALPHSKKLREFCEQYPHHITYKNMPMHTTAYDGTEVHANIFCWTVCRTVNEAELYLANYVDPVSGVPITKHAEHHYKLLPLPDTELNIYIYINPYYTAQMNYCKDLIAGYNSKVKLVKKIETVPHDLRGASQRLIDQRRTGQNSQSPSASRYPSSPQTSQSPQTPQSQYHQPQYHQPQPSPQTPRPQYHQPQYLQPQPSPQTPRPQYRQSPSAQQPQPSPQTPRPQYRQPPSVQQPQTPQSQFPSSPPAYNYPSNPPPPYNQ
uniref:Uncharacterized protein n=1 Tax=Trachysalambria curvirostris majanivirus TaxID=2984281 RepID=A0A9C7C909_9VIRU|nr:MAG: hypothetical protein [Trachysalambria curvirostris majanivirus]